MSNLFKINNEVTDVALVSLLITLNRFYTLFWCFYCWLWTSKCRLGLVSKHWSCVFLLENPCFTFRERWRFHLKYFSITITHFTPMLYSILYPLRMSENHFWALKKWTIGLTWVYWRGTLTLYSWKTWHRYFPLPQDTMIPKYFRSLKKI